MAIALAHLKRFKDIAQLLLKHGRAIRDLPTSLLGDALEPEELAGRSASAAAGATATDPAAELARDLEALGPTFVKLGQVLATRADLLPVSYLAALSRLQDDVAPFPFAEVEAIVEAELGVKIGKAFSDFEPTPLAAASLGQVHRAAMRDGRLVAVKVQRPGVQETIAEDLAALAEAAALLDQHTETGRSYRFSGFVEEFKKSLVRELDYRQEAQNLIELGKILEPFERIVVPRRSPTSPARTF